MRFEKPWCYLNFLSFIIITLKYIMYQPHTDPLLFHITELLNSRGNQKSKLEWIDMFPGQRSSVDDRVETPHTYYTAV